MYVLLRRQLLIHRVMIFMLLMQWHVRFRFVSLEEKMLCITCNIPHVNSKHPHDCDLKLSVQVNPPSLVKVFSSFFQLAEIRIVAVKDSRPCFVYLRSLDSNLCFRFTNQKNDIIGREIVSTMPVFRRHSSRTICSHGWLDALARFNLNYLKKINFKNGLSVRNM